MGRIVIDARESGSSTGRYIDKLVANLHELRPRHTIVLLAKKRRVEFYKKLAPRFEVQTTRFKEFTFGEQLGLLKQIRAQKPNLVFFPAAHQPILYRGKVVTTIQDLTTARFRNPAKNWLAFTIKRWVYKFVVRRVARKSSRLITPSEFVKEDIARFARINSRKITVTHEAADPITEQPVAIPELENKEYIMYVGRPQAHKNLGRLIDAFAVLRQTHPNLRLVLAGKKDALYKKHARYAQAKGIKNIIFTGFVSEGELRWLYEHTRAYVFPSLSEGFGLPGLEAMAHGAPVVSSNATCLPEVYQDAAVYFDPHSTDDIAKKIETMLTDSKTRTQCIQRGRKLAASYSWKAMAQQTLAVFDEVLSR